MDVLVLSAIRGEIVVEKSSLIGLYAVEVFDLGRTLSILVSMVDELSADFEIVGEEVT